MPETNRTPVNFDGAPHALSKRSNITASNEAADQRVASGRFQSDYPSGRRRMDMSQHARPLCRHSLTAGTERREQGAKLRLIEKVRLDVGAARPLEIVIAWPPLPLRSP
jgi:hypothetical protein